jgi:integrator complex subunit 4
LGEKGQQLAWSGAFVHGWEDEYYQVRSASVDSICELALQSDEFAKQAIEVLVDLFNDDTDTVRRSAIHSVARLGRRYVD